MQPHLISREKGITFPSVFLEGKELEMLERGSDVRTTRCLSSLQRVKHLRDGFTAQRSVGPNYTTGAGYAIVLIIIAEIL